MIPVSLVTPSTSLAISSPNSVADLLQAGAGVLDRVVQERRAERLGVEPHPGADLGDPDRMGDELVAGAAQLVGVAVAGEVEGAPDRLAVDRRGGQRRVAVAAGALGGRRVELLDHGEEVAEELVLIAPAHGLLRRSRYRSASWCRAP